MQAAAIRSRNVNPLVLTLINLHTGVQRDSAALTPPRQRRKSALSADMRQCMSPIPDNLRILGTSLKTEANADASQPASQPASHLKQPPPLPTTSPTCADR